MTPEQREHKRVAAQEYNRAYYLKNREKIKARAAAWRVANPERAREAVDRWHRENKERKQEYDREYRDKNAARLQQQSREWYVKTRDERAERERQRRREWWLANKDRWQVYKQNRRAREREQGGQLSTGLVRTLMERQQSKCVACSGRIRKGWRHLDHIVPLARGGSHTDENMQLLCPPCNLEKADRDPIEFMQSKGFLL